MGEHYGRTNSGELIGPYETCEELRRELLAANAELIALSIAIDITAMARNSGVCPIVWVTGNNFMPPLRSFDQAEYIWQEDETGEAFEHLVERLEQLLDKAEVLLDCPEYDNALYAVDLARFEYVEGDGDNLADDWQAKS
jgi:hypothetical protein